MKRFTFLLAVLGLSLHGISQECSDIFISEYVEGSGNSKGIEIYNPTESIIDLSAYVVVRFSNGGVNPGVGYITQLQGFLQPASTFILVNGQTEDIDLGGSTSPKCDPALQAMADQLDNDYPAPMYMNGNDAIALFKHNGTVKDLGDDTYVDLFGTIGGNMTSSDEGWTDFTDAWAYKNIYDTEGNLTGKDSTYITDYIVPEGYYWLPWTANHTLVRKASVKEGVKSDPGVFVVTEQWDTLAGGADVWTNLGTHDCACQSNSISNSLALSQVKIYPNPVEQGYFTLSSAEELSEIHVFDNTGRIIRSYEALNGIRKKQIDVSELIQGLYIVRISYINGKTGELKFQKIN